MNVGPLFKPFKVGNLSLPNRIVMAPMTRAFSPGGVPGPDVANYYRRRAENSVGLIVTEGTEIDHPSASGYPNVPHLYGENALNGWSKVVAAVHEAGGRIMSQLWHVGMLRKIRNHGAPPVGPSGLSLSGAKITEPMTKSEIDLVVEAYAKAAAIAKRIGFDGIEIHGAHGYLIDQFFWENTNSRNDYYGGDLVARTRFAVEVIEACRRAVGSDFPIMLRISQWKTAEYKAKLVVSPDQLARFLEPLAEAGVDIFHCSTRRFWESEFEGSSLNLAGWTRKLTGKPTITVGSIGLKMDRLLEMMGHSEFDLVAVGRALLADPAWAAKIRESQTNEIIKFHTNALKTLS